jgi:hypothetical protein
MKPKSPLLGCFAKIEWAESEIDDVQTKINGLVKPVPQLNIFAPQKFPGDKPRPPPKPYPTGFSKSTATVDSNGVEVWRYVVPEIPTALNVTVGAILHSLRTPLDQMLSAIALKTHDSPRGVAFPFGRNREEFEISLGKQTKLPLDARKLIGTLKPYRGGNALLYALHALNNPDKHHPGLVPINMQTITGVEAIAAYRGMVLTIGPRTGRHLAIDMDNNFSQSDKTKAPAYDGKGDNSRMSSVLIGESPTNCSLRDSTIKREVSRGPTLPIGSLGQNCPRTHPKMIWKSQPPFPERILRQKSIRPSILPLAISKDSSVSRLSQFSMGCGNSLRASC